jgi:hypothetical protein
MLDAEIIKGMIAELNATVAGLSLAVDNLCDVIADLRLENARLQLELHTDFIAAPWLPVVGQA